MPNVPSCDQPLVRPAWRYEAMGCLHVINAQIRMVKSWGEVSEDAKQMIDRAIAYRLKAHVLLGGDPPQTYGEACLMADFPECDSHEWDNRTTSENRQWLYEQWGLESPA